MDQTKPPPATYLYYLSERLFKEIVRRVKRPDEPLVTEQSLIVGAHLFLGKLRLRANKSFTFGAAAIKDKQNLLREARKLAELPLPEAYRIQGIVDPKELRLDVPTQHLYYTLGFIHSGVKEDHDG